MQHRISQRAISVILMGLTVLMAGLVPVRDSVGQRARPNSATANRIEGITRSRQDPSSGNLAIYALQTCLDTQNYGLSYSRIAGISGIVFKFVYDTTEAYEPLRDLYPVDVLQLGAVEMGFKDASWDMGRSVAEAMKLVKREIDEGRPVIAPNIGPEAYAGLYVITGYDLDTQHFLIQGAVAGEGYDSVSVADGWDGPTMSPAGWASNPVFLMGRQAAGRGDARAGRHASVIASGIESMKGGEIEYGKNPNAQAYLGQAGVHRAGYGIEGIDRLYKDITTRPLVTIKGGEPSLDFGFLWRIDSQVGQLQLDRLQGYSFLRSLRTGLAIEDHALLEEATGNFFAVSKDAETLRGLFWQPIPPDVATPDSVLGFVRESPAMVFKVPASASLIEDLKAMGEPVFETSWGTALVDDSEDKRLTARLLVRAIISRERNSIRILEELLPDVDVRVEHDRPEDERRPHMGQQEGE